MWRFSVFRLGRDSRKIFQENSHFHFDGLQPRRSEEEAPRADHLLLAGDGNIAKLKATETEMLR